MRVLERIAKQAAANGQAQAIKQPETVPDQVAKQPESAPEKDKKELPAWASAPLLLI
jgi:hypothetical protein